MAGCTVHHSFSRIAGVVRCVEERDERGNRSSTFACLLILALLAAPFGSAMAAAPAVSAFTLKTDHLITDRPFQLTLVPGTRLEQLSVGSLELQASCEPPAAAEGEKTYPLRAFSFRPTDSGTVLRFPSPSRDSLRQALGEEPHRLCLIARYALGDVPIVDRFPLTVPSKLVAYLIAFGFLLAFFLLIATLKANPLKPMREFAADECEARWKASNGPFQRAVKQPLAFAITPMGTYSISLTQALFWTYLTIFMSVYVYWLSGDLLDLTPQILAMLGIGGGTAIAAKVNATARAHTLPPKYLGLIKRTRIPQLGDLISSQGRPNLFKFQILAFTLIAGGFVLLETLQSFTLPEIPESLVVLMGISNVVYLGNEVSAENLWEKIKQLQDAIEAHAKEENRELDTAADVNQHGKQPEVDELKAALEAIYG